MMVEVAQGSRQQGWARQKNQANLLSRQQDWARQETRASLLSRQRNPANLLPWQEKLVLLGWE